MHQRKQTSHPINHVNANLLVGNTVIHAASQTSINRTPIVFHPRDPPYHPPPPSLRERDPRDADAGSKGPFPKVYERRRAASNHGVCKRSPPHASMTDSRGSNW